MGGVVPGSSVVGSFAPASTRTFDVGSEHEILTLLNYIRRGPFDLELKNALRDRVLDYATNNDESTLKVLAGDLSNVGIIITHGGVSLISDTTGVVPPSEQEKKESSESAKADNHNHTSVPFGMARPLPSFSSHISREADVPNIASKPERDGVPENKRVETKPAAVTENQTLGGHVETELPSTPPAKSEPPVVPVKQESPRPVQVPIAPVPPPPSPSSVTSETEMEKVVPAPEIQSVASSSQPSLQQAVSQDKHGYIDRIKEIKKQVNERVGNPVNLIDVNNTVGREYMNALLNAMRVVAGDNEEEMKIAMDRLEKAYHDVETTIPDTIKKKTMTAEQVAPTAEQDISKDVLIPDTQQKSSPEPMQEVSPSTPPAASVTERVSPDLIDASKVAEVNASLEPEAPLGPPPEPIQAKPTPPKSSMQQLAEEVRLPMRKPQPPEAQKTVRADGVVEGPMSIAEKLKQEQEKRQEILHERIQEKNQQELAAQSTDPLFAEEVSGGLRQLLSEWRLFKSSGIFGTGPSGIDHPLYKKLATLPMAAVIAGRFEGITPEIKQSITDYMNGWRYEQGIVHEMGETFEHYLRRVIREILDKRKATQVQ